MARRPHRRLQIAPCLVLLRGAPVCARGRRFSRPSAWAICRAFKKARKSKTSRCTVSGAVLISSISVLVNVLMILLYRNGGRSAFLLSSPFGDLGFDLRDGDAFTAIQFR